MKKKLMLLLVILMIVSLAFFGCQSQAPSGQTTDSTTDSTADQQAADSGDKDMPMVDDEEIDFDNLVVPEDEAGREELRMKLAQQYKNAEPGEKFLVGHITFHLEQEYAMMVMQANEQAAEQLGLEFMGAVASSDAEWIEVAESMMAAGAKAITMNVPSMAALPEIVKLAEENNVFLATHFGYTGDLFPGDLGPRWVVDNTPLSDEQTYMPLMVLMEKMTQDGKTKLLHTIVVSQYSFGSCSTQPGFG